jgi:hypothetical protein
MDSPEQIIDLYYAHHWYDEVLNQLQIVEDGYEFPLDRRLYAKCQKAIEESFAVDILEAGITYVDYYERFRDRQREANNSLLETNKEEIQLERSSERGRDEYQFLIAFTVDPWYTNYSYDVPNSELDGSSCDGFERQGDETLNDGIEVVDWPAHGRRPIVVSVEELLQKGREFRDKEGKNPWEEGSGFPPVLSTTEEVWIPELEWDACNIISEKLQKEESEDSKRWMAMWKYRLDHPELSHPAPFNAGPGDPANYPPPVPDDDDTVRGPTIPGRSKTPDKPPEVESLYAPLVNPLKRRAGGSPDTPARTKEASHQRHQH